LADLIPLPVLDFVLEEVIKVDATFASIASEEVQAVSERDASGSRPGLRTTVNELELAHALGGDIVHIPLLVHCSIPSYSLRHRVPDIILDDHVLRKRNTVVVQSIFISGALVHLATSHRGDDLLAVNMRVPSCLIDLMPLFCFWIELVHIVSPGVGISTSKQIEEAAMLDYCVACPGSINYFVVRAGALFFALFVVDILFRDNTLPLSMVEILIELWIIDVQLVAARVLKEVII